MIRRRIFNFTTGASLLLCAATLLLWASSFLVTYSLSKARIAPLTTTTTVRQRTQFYTSIQLVEGRLNFGKSSQATTIQTQWDWTWRVRSDSGFNLPTTLGFFYDYGAGNDNVHGNYSSLAIVIPFLLIPALTAIVPIYWIYRWRKRIKPNGCPSCGYNLTGNTSGVCPECGTPVPGKLEAIA